MRRILLAVPFLFACGGGAETPPADAPATASTMLTEADVSGTWQGTAMVEGTDSVFAHWTQVCGNGTCTGTSQESTDTIRSTYTLSADSSIGVAGPMADATMGGIMVTDNWVARMSNATVTGTGVIRLADRPDSVLMRYRFTGTRVP